MGSLNDVDVLVTDNTTVDLVLFDYWLDGFSVEQSLEMVRRTEARFLKHFSNDFVVVDILDQYRTFALIEKLLPCPSKLNEDWTFRLSDATKVTLVEKFYDFDEPVMHAILSRKLSARSRKDLDEVSRKSGKSLKSCRRQFDNFRRIFKTIDGLPGNLVGNIRAHFLLSERLAQKYADYMCYNRFELNKRRPFRGWTSVFRN